LIFGRVSEIGIFDWGSWTGLEAYSFLGSVGLYSVAFILLSTLFAAADVAIRVSSLYFVLFGGLSESCIGSQDGLLSATLLFSVEVSDWITLESSDFEAISDFFSIFSLDSLGGPYIGGNADGGG
jgi:hypothetical protein